MDVQTYQPRPWDKLPVDIILELTKHLPFFPNTLTSLSLTTKHLHAILTTYERSISATIALTQYRTATTLYPPSSLPTLHSPTPTPHPTYAYLAALHNRTTTITNLTSLLSPADSTSLLTHQHVTHWTTLLTAGLHILYRLCDIPNHSDKITYLHTHLSLPSLALLHLTLLIATKTAEQHGHSRLLRTR